MERLPIPHRPELTPIFPTPPELEASTVEMVARAPYCGLGFRKGRLEPELHARMLDSLRRNAPHFRPEQGDNPWIGTRDAKTIPAVVHQDHQLNAEISRALQPAHEAWSGMSLTESACYGIRVYQRGSYLFNHVDRTETHIISSTICVDHRLDEPWPLTLEDIDGQLHQVDMEPGEFLYYEGAKLRHGRPYPLVGDYYAGMFVHYRPVHLESVDRPGERRGPGA
ncbi:MAG: hypothetical protein AAF560_16085 [Acidobacteriota bacterium]